MRTRRLCLMALLLAGVLAAACSGRSITGDPLDDALTEPELDAGDADDRAEVLDGDDPSDAVPDPDPDLPRDVGFEWPDAAPDAPELPAPVHEAVCGDGIVDPGEECDDHNRLDGDGCDWSCMYGDGTAVPTSDPDVGDFELQIPAITVVTDPGDPVYSQRGARLPLVWTGSRYAAAWSWWQSDVHGPPSCPCGIRFVRFDREGVPVDSGWFYEIPDFSWGIDLVWTGDGFGLPFDVNGQGIYLLRLDAAGKPLGDPTMVVPDPDAHAPSADLVDDGYVLAWTALDEARVRLVSRLGDADGLPGPMTVEVGVEQAVDVAAGDGGFAVTMVRDDSQQLVRTSSTLSTVRYSGLLGPGLGGDVVWADGRYITAWIHTDVPGWEEYATCVARFLPDGDLERAPVCTSTGLWHSGHGYPGPSRLASGAGGLGIVWQYSSDLPYANPVFLRTDMLGVPISAKQNGGGVLSGFTINVAIAWADPEFGLLFHSQPSAYLHTVTPLD